MPTKCVAIRPVELTDIAAVASLRAATLGASEDSLIQKFKSEISQGVGSAHWAMRITREPTPEY